MEVMTPDIIARPEGSPSFWSSSEATDSLFICREDQEPLVLVGAGPSNPPLPSFLLSVGLSLCSLLPKNDGLPADDCLDCLSACEVATIVVLRHVREVHEFDRRQGHDRGWDKMTTKFQRRPMLLLICDQCTLHPLAQVAARVWQKCETTPRWAAGNGHQQRSKSGVARQIQSSQRTISSCTKRERLLEVNRESGAALTC